MKQGKLLTLGRKVNSHGQLHAIRGVFAGLLGGLLLAHAATAWAATYRWTDDQGQTIYSQIPPNDDRPYTKIGAPPPPPDGAGARKELERLRQEQADRREDKALADEEERKSAEKQAAVDRNCAAARRNVESLQGGAGRLMRMPDGSVRRMTAEERRAKLEEAQKYLDENCR